MVIIEQDINLPAVGTVPPSIRLTQYDTAIKLVFSLYNGSSKFEKPEGGKAYISMTKADNKIVHVETTYNDDGTVEFQLTQQMTAAPGEAYCKLVVTGADGQVSTTSFILIVAEAGAKDGGVISESEISDVEKIVEAAEIAKDALTNISAAKADALDSVAETQANAESAIATDKTDALNSIASSKSNALDSIATAKTDAVNAAQEQANIAKGWAVGPNGSGSGTATNNAKYWAEKAASVVTGVTSFNGRTGAVTPQNGDYSYSQISDTPSNATTSAAGLMSASDKSKLDGIAANATKVTVDSALSSTSTNPVQNKIVNTRLLDLFNDASSHVNPNEATSTISMIDGWKSSSELKNVPEGFSSCRGILLTLTQGGSSSWSGTNKNQIMLWPSDSGTDIYYAARRYITSTSTWGNWVTFHSGTDRQCSKKLATKSLTASGGTLTWTDSEIGDTSLIDVYATIPNIAPSAISQSGTTLTVTFDAQDSAFDVSVTVRN